MATNLKLAQEIAALLVDIGCPFKAVGSAPDLGVDRGCRVASSKPTATKRFRAAKGKNTKFVKLVRAAQKWKAGKILFQSGTRPQAGYDAKIHGLPPTKVKELRRAAGAVISAAKHGRCLTTRLAIEYGDSEPAFAIPLDLITAWFDTLTQYPNDLEVEEGAWRKVYDRLYLNKNKWRHVTGSMSAIIATLLDMGWFPCDADAWYDDKGDMWAFGKDAQDSWTGAVDSGQATHARKPVDFRAQYPDFSELTAAISETIRKKLWKAAAEHRNGRGMEEGVDLHGLRRHIKSAEKRKDFQLKGALVATASAAPWTRARVQEASKLPIDDLCARCGLHVETDAHRAWGCKANDELKECNGSKFLIKRALEQVENMPCLWLRGVVPKAWTQVDPPTDEPKIATEHIGFDKQYAPTGPQLHEGTSSKRVWGCGDGSGGLKSSDPRLRRAAWAWVLLEVRFGRPTGCVRRTSTGNLPGRRQTVNRAELMALLHFLQSTCGNASFVTDSAYVQKGFCKMRSGRGKHRSNRDLWSLLHQVCFERDVEVHKVESHLELDGPEVRSGEVPYAWVYGNQHADVIAGETAAEFAVPYAQVAAVDWVDAQAHLIRKRLAATLIDAAEKDLRARKAPPAPPPLRRKKKEAQLLAATSSTDHSLPTPPLVLNKCLVCGTVPAKKQLLKWLATPCVPPVPLPFCPSASRGGDLPIALGTTTVHASHAPVFYEEQGYWACTTCGAAGGARLKGLAAICGGVMTKSGTEALSRLKKGLKPGSSAAVVEYNRTRAGNGPKRKAYVRSKGVTQNPPQRSNARRATKAAAARSSAAAAACDGDDSSEADSDSNDDVSRLESSANDSCCAAGSPKAQITNAQGVDLDVPSSTTADPGAAVGQPKPTSQPTASQLKRRGIGGRLIPAATKRARLTEEEEARNDLAELKALGFKVAEPLTMPVEDTTSQSSSAAAAASAISSEPLISHPDEALTDDLRAERTALEGLLDLDDAGLKVAWPIGLDRASARSRVKHLASLQPPRDDVSAAAPC